MKKLLLLSIFLLGACSSPPEAPKVDWDKKEEVMNTQLMTWSPTDHVIKSDVVNGHWQQKITGFVPENRFYNDSVFLCGCSLKTYHRRNIRKHCIFHC